MSPSKLNSSERQAAKDRKVSGHQAAGGGTAASAYNPSSGTFRTLEPLSSDIGAGYITGRFKSIDDTDDNASLNGGGVDLDCMSNNGSYSGESEDQLHSTGKDSHGSGKLGTGDTDKRDKIRGKNERKHQRQKERRAQELRDKCTGYLMSRKLEALAQKLVAMGFSQERATMALIVNDGHVEQSVTWLFEGGEGQVHEDWSSGGNPKIDITEELGELLEIEKKYKLSRHDIERAVVACEGDLVRALELLCVRNQSSSLNRDEVLNAQSQSRANTEEEPSASLPAVLRNSAATQAKGNAVLQPHQNERTAVFCSDGGVCVNSLDPYVSLDPSSKAYANVRKHPNPLTDPQSLAQEMLPSVFMKSSPLVSPFSSASNVESGLVFGFGTPNPRLISIPNKEYAQNGPVKEHAYMGHMHSRMSFQPIVPPNNCTGTSSAFSPSSWSSGFLEGSSPSSVLPVSVPHGEMGWKATNASKNPIESLELGLSSLPQQCNPFVSIQANSGASHWNVPGQEVFNEIRCHPSFNSTTHSESPAKTSCGRFTGWGAGFSQSSVDWSSGPKPNCDYRNIDWSMNSCPSDTKGLSGKLSSLILQEKSGHQWSLQPERRFQTGARAGSFSTDSFHGYGIWKVAPPGAGMQDSIPIEAGTSAHEWTSPFTGKALFSLPQVVSSPSL